MRIRPESNSPPDTDLTERALSARRSIDRKLGRYVRRRRVVAAVRATFFATTAFTAVCLIACIVDRYVGFNRPVRTAVVAVSTIIAMVLLGPAALLFRRRFDPVTAAVSVEAKIPSLAGRLTTAVSPSVVGTSPQLLAVILDQAALELPPKLPVSVRPVALPAMMALVAAAMVFAAIRNPRLDMPGLIRRLAHPMTVLPPVTATQLFVQPTPVSVPVGQPLRLSCTAVPVDPSSVILHVSDDAGRTWTTWAMTADPAAPGTFFYNWATVTTDLRFFISAGDATGPTGFITASARPVVVDFRTRVEPPKYVHRSIVTGTGNDAPIDAVDGSAVTVDILCSRPVWRVTASTQGRTTEIRPAADPSTARYAMVVHGDQKIELRPIGSDGQAGEPRAIEIRAQPDRPPTVRFLDPVEVAPVGPDWKVDGGYEAADDFGVASATTEVRVDDRRPVTTNRPVANAMKNATVEDPIELKPLGLSPGDVVTVHVRARDGREPNPQSTSTEAHYFLIVPEPGDPTDGKRLADLTAAQEWVDRLATDPAALGNVRICLQRAAFHGRSRQYAGFVAGLADRPIDSIRADLKTLLAAERASDVIRMKAAIAWIDGRATPERNGSERMKARDRLSARIEAESQKLGVSAGQTDMIRWLHGFEQTADELMRARVQAEGAVIPPGPALTAERPPTVSAVRRDADLAVPGYDDAVRIYLNRINATSGK